MTNKKRKVLVIGWDAADWKIINKLMDEGLMPTMESLVNNGVMGNLSTLEPPFSPMLWTTIATGVLPDKHGILGFTEPMPDNLGVRPVSSTSRKVKAIWNILMQEGYKVHNVGWWPSHPAEPLNGISVSNHYQSASNHINKPWPMKKGTVHPEELSGLFKELRMHPTELTEEHILPFVPEAGKIDQDKDKRLEGIAKILTDATNIQNAATWILENQDWDFMAVYFDAIDHLCHGFMNFHPPRMKDIPEDQYNLYKDVITSIYRFHDMMLKKLIDIAGEDTTIVVLSDHGFHSDHLRPANLPDEPAAPAFQHRNHGIICIKGPGIKNDERIYGASLLDITPTILSLYDLPIGEDMDGTPLVNIYEKPLAVKTIPSWEDVQGDCGMHSAEIIEDPYDSQEALNQLVELGYIEEPDENVQKNVEVTIKESQYNLARVYMGSSRFRKAIPLLEELYKKYNEESRISVRLAKCYLAVSKFEECRKLSKSFIKNTQKKILTKQEIEEFKKELQNKDHEIKEVKERNTEIRKTIKKSNTLISDHVQLAILEGEILLKENKPKEALELYKKIEITIPDKKGLHMQIGQAYMKLSQWNDAIPKFKDVLKNDPENSDAHHGLCICYLNLKLYYEAIDVGLTSIGLNYYNSLAHFHLGEALFHIEEYEQSAQAFEVSLHMNAGIAKARNYLIDLYDNYLNNKAKAIQHKEFYNKKSKIIEEKVSQEKEENIKLSNIKSKNFILNKEPIIIVSGLPRSGTSMMMQMLEAGGIPSFTDQVRKADKSNPKGYYEHEAVKRLARDKKWIPKAKGKSVKIIAHLLLHLPLRHNYKIIFMERDFEEVINSQHKMLESLGKIKHGEYHTGLESNFKKTLDKIKVWKHKNFNVDILYINHSDVITNPLEQAIKVKEFLNIEMNEKEMTKCVNPQLYRSKVNTLSKV